MDKCMLMMDNENEQVLIIFFCINVKCQCMTLMTKRKAGFHASLSNRSTVPPGGGLSSEKVADGWRLSKGYKSKILVSVRGLMTKCDYS